jgi:hypothetical protein
MFIPLADLHGQRKDRGVDLEHSVIRGSSDYARGHSFCAVRIQSDHGGRQATIIQLYSNDN